MHQVLTIIAVYLTALVAGGIPMGASSTEPDLMRQTRDFHNNCKEIAIVNAGDRPRLARAPQPPLPMPYITAGCRGADGKHHRSKLALDYCLGWNPNARLKKNLIPQNNGFGIQKGKCYNCQYLADDYYSFMYKCTCMIPDLIDVDRDYSEARYFEEPGVIHYDPQSGRLRCFNHLGI
ncbi:hypothetical protein BDV26DRAFT_295921 [Aspergillus bertholletiae]|uniref:Cyanovirin-N domain-containing protein n=1 Tax=Aspergillus bertholletiae TaxID=1226010 RepID=A0A5N7AXI0_9EURO|nr:hypothetical protein BDV26DRAFT_295921 [Aspergillus bertholletiae]